MSKLEELKAASDTAWVAWAVASAATNAARDAAWAADAVYWDYKDGLKRLQEENSNE